MSHQWNATEKLPLWELEKSNRVTTYTSPWISWGLWQPRPNCWPTAHTFHSTWIQHTWLPLLLALTSSTQPHPVPNPSPLLHTWSVFKYTGSRGLEALFCSGCALFWLKDPRMWCWGMFGTLVSDTWSAMYPIVPLCPICYLTYIHYTTWRIKDSSVTLWHSDLSLSLPITPHHHQRLWAVVSLGFPSPSVRLACHPLSPMNLFPCSGQKMYHRPSLLDFCSYLLIE